MGSTSQLSKPFGASILAMPSVSAVPVVPLARVVLGAPCAVSDARS